MAKKKAKGKKPVRPIVGAGSIIKASAGKMTESDLQKKVDRDARRDGTKN
jgi:hypothetical protein